MQNLVYTNTFLVQSISLWNQVFRDTGPFFFCQKNGKKPCGNKKLQSYRVTELQSISPGNEDNFIFLQKKMKKSYRVTELQSYRVTECIQTHSWYNPSLSGIRSSEIRDPFFFVKKMGKNLVETKSYRVTELQSYNPSLPGMRTILFFCKKK